MYLLQIGSLIYFEHPKYLGYGIVVSLTERIAGRTQVEFFFRHLDVYPVADIPEAGIE